MIFITKCLILLIIFPKIVKSAREPPQVTIPDQGTVMGTFLKMFRIQTVIAYLGIPYAQPPLAEKRFTPPVVDDLPRWSGVRNASQMPPDCWQSVRRAKRKKHDEIFANLLQKMAKDEDDSMSGGAERQFDEDCLYLNVFVPDGKPAVCSQFRLSYIKSIQTLKRTHQEQGKKTTKKNSIIEYLL